ncbi:MAG: hypothetical protein Kow0069_28080 [Promethearchaeota archaeon]
MLVLQLTEFLTRNPWILSLFWIVVIVLVGVLVDRLATKFIRRVGKQRDLPKHVENAFIMLLRVGILAFVLVGVLRIAGLPSDVVVAISALGGTTVGLASSRTVGNLFAGMWVFITRPYHVGDYISLGGTLEGIVEEITLNRTKIRSSLDTMVTLSNQSVLDSVVTNYRVDDREGKTTYYRYPVRITTDVTVPLARVEEVVRKAAEAYADRMHAPPDVSVAGLARLDKSFLVHVSFIKPEDVLEVVPGLLENVAAGLSGAK